MTAQIIGYRAHILWMNTYEHPLICQEFVTLTRLAHLQPHLTCIINLRNKPMQLITTAVLSPPQLSPGSTAVPSHTQHNHFP